MLEQSGLAAAVSQLARTVAERADLDLGMDTTGWPETARTANDLLLFGTARELLSNVARHARASTLSVELSLRDGNAQLIISDDGVGADPELLPDGSARGTSAWNRIG